MVDEEEGAGLPAKGYYERFFREEGSLGSGAEGSVFLATHIIGGNTLGELSTNLTSMQRTANDRYIRRQEDCGRHKQRIPRPHAS